MAKLKQLDYQNKLEDIKESGGIEKQSKVGAESTDPVKPLKKSRLKNLGSSGQPYVSGKYSSPIKEEGLGTSRFDSSSINMPNEFYDATLDVQNQIYQSELLEARAQEQSKGYKLLAGLGRAAAKTGTEFGKGIGYLGGGVAAVFTGELDTIINNEFVKAFEGLDEKAKESIPVYVRREIENGSLGRQIWSPEFWATEGADAVGFMASSILTGGLVGMAAKSGLTKGLANLAKFSGISKGGATAEKSAELFLNTTAQSYVESMAETDGAIQEFDEFWNERLTEDGRYLKPGTEDEFMSAEEVAALRGELGAMTIALNMVATAGPNYFTSKALFGSAGRSRNLFDELGVDTNNINSMKEGLAAAATKKQVVKSILAEGAKGAASEGFQEASQFSIGQYGKAKSRLQTNDDLVEGLIDGYIDAVTTIDGQKSIFLGAVLGLGPGLKKGFSERKSRIERASGLTKMMEESIIDLKQDFESYYVKNEDGSIKMQGDEAILDYAKIKKDIEATEESQNTDALLALAKKEGYTVAAKSIVAKKLMEKAIPYFQEMGGDEIFMKHFEELSETMETDGKLIGFSSKEDYTGFLKDVVKDLKKEYDYIKEQGPRHFGINIAEYQEKFGKQEGVKALETFYQQMEAQGALWSSLMNINKKELLDVDKKIGEITQTVANNYMDKAAKPKEVKEGDKIGSPDVGLDTMFTYMVDNIKANREYKNLIAKKKALESNLKDINDKYKSLFNKKEQQSAFNSVLESEKRKAEDQKTYEETLSKNKDFADRFYNTLKEKGYGEDIQDTINSNKVRLEDKDGNILAIMKLANKTGGKEFYLVPTNDMGVAVISKAEKLTAELMEKKGLDETNIMTPEDYQTWVKTARMLHMNNLRMERLSSLINRYKTKAKETAAAIDSKERTERLKDLNDRIEFWKTQTEIPFNEIVDEVNKIEKEAEDVVSEIKILKESLVVLGENIDILEGMKRELSASMRYDKNYSFGVVLQKLKDRFEAEGFEAEEESLQVLTDITGEQIYELEFLQDSLQIATDNLYDFLISNGNFISQLIADVNNNRESDLRPTLQLLREKYPEYLGAEVTMEEVQTMMRDPDTRNDFINFLKDKGGDIKSMYIENRNKLAEVSKRLNEAKKQNEKNIANAVAIRRMEIVEKNIDYLKTQNNIAIQKEMEKEYVSEAFGQGVNSNRRIEQNGTSSKEVNNNGPLKHNEFSTIVNVYEDSNNSVPHTNLKKRQQANDWSTAMMNISLDELNRYSVKILNAKQLSSQGIIPPVDESGALYSMLYKDGAPYIGKSGSKVFAGIANLDTYFPPGGKPTINIDDSSEVQLLNSRNAKSAITQLEPYSYRGDLYPSYDTAYDAIVEYRRLEYKNWRDGLVNKTNDGQDIFLEVNEISKGHPAFYSDTQNNINEVFPGEKKLHVGKKFIKKKNGKKVPVVDGAVYVELANGQVQRVLNKSIGTLAPAERLKILNKIIGFMSLASELGKDYKKQFPIKGLKGGKIALFGHAGRPGIMDTLISWNTKNEDWKISMATRKSTGEKAYAFHMKGQKIWMPLSELFDANGNVRKATDPKLTQLVAYLDYKHLNVVDGNLNKGIFMPDSYKVSKLGSETVVEIIGKSHKDYNKFLMDNYLYTDIPVPTDSDALPMMVNQYIELGGEKSAKPVVEPEDKATEVTESKYKIVPEGAVLTESSTPEATLSKMDALKSAIPTAPNMPLPPPDVSAEGTEKIITATGAAAGIEMSPAMAAMMQAMGTAPQVQQTEEKKEEDCAPASPFSKKPKLL